MCVIIVSDHEGGRGKELKARVKEWDKDFKNLGRKELIEFVRKIRTRVIIFRFDCTIKSV